MGIALRLVYLSALLLDIGQLVVILGVFVLFSLAVDAIQIVVLGLVELASQQVDVALVLDLAHQAGAVLVVRQDVLFVRSEGVTRLVQQIEDCTVLEVD